MAHLFSVQSLTKSYGRRHLFADIGFGVEDSEHMGLIGPNGAGKSTLLRIIAGHESPDTGTVSRRRGIRIGYVAQQDSFPDGATVRSVIESALPTHFDEDERAAKIAVVMARFGFDEPDQTAAGLSGGWGKRLAIAEQTVQDPDALLLDEPTNHLDIEGIVRLEDLLKSAPFAYIVISHDRYFLEHVAGRIVELSRSYPQGFFSVDGSYSEFLLRREEFLAAQARREETLSGQVRTEIEWLRRGPPARTTKAKYRIEEAGIKIQDLADVRERNAEDQGAKVDFAGSGRKTRDLLVTKGVGKSLGGKLLFSGLDLTLAPGIRLGLLGANGVGKSTLIHVLTGLIPPDVGTVKAADALRIGFLEQDRMALDTSLTLRQALAGDSETVQFNGAAMHIVAWAKKFLFRPEQLDSPVSRLSGGEQARILIARLMLQPVDLLVLDEPTNDLDIPTLELLERSLIDFPGALLLVSHDRFLIERVTTEVLALDGHGGALHFADYEQWRSSALPTPAAKPSKAAAPSPSRPSSHTQFKLTRSEQREFDRMEESIAAAEADLAQFNTEMTAESVVTDYVKLQDAIARVAAQEQAISLLYERWEELEAKRKS